MSYYLLDIASSTPALSMIMGRKAAGEMPNSIRVLCDNTTNKTLCDNTFAESAGQWCHNGRKNNVVLPLGYTDNADWMINVYDRKNVTIGHFCHGNRSTRAPLQNVPQASRTPEFKMPHSVEPGH
jgi:hypothetical protein